MKKIITCLAIILIKLLGRCECGFKYYSLDWDGEIHCTKCKKVKTEYLGGK